MLYAVARAAWQRVPANWCQLIGHNLTFFPRASVQRVLLWGNVHPAPPRLAGWTSAASALAHTFAILLSLSPSGFTTEDKSLGGGGRRSRCGSVPLCWYRIECKRHKSNEFSLAAGFFAAFHSRFTNKRRGKVDVRMAVFRHSTKRFYSPSNFFTC